MANLINTGSQWLRDQLNLHASESVTYKRGQLSVVLNATLGNSESDTYTGDQGDVVVTLRMTDFIFDPATLILNGTVVKPQKGDSIAHNGTTYRVCGLEGESCWRKSGSHGAMIRVHTEEIKVSS